ncbi:MAG: hypothetical protein ABI861_10655 [Panacibacter sp.]
MQEISQLPFRNLPLFLNKFKIEKANFINEYQNWQLSNPDQTFSNFMWNYFESITINLSEKARSHAELYQNMSEIYGFMLSYSLEDKKDSNLILKSKNYYELMAHKHSGYKTFVTIIGRKDCKKCANLNYIVPIDIEIKKRSIPFTSCPFLKKGYPMCSCTYGFILERGDDGLPIKTKHK